jgi:hypothetical protein
MHHQMVQEVRVARDPKEWRYHRDDGPVEERAEEAGLEQPAVGGVMHGEDEPLGRAGYHDARHVNKRRSTCHLKMLAVSQGCT